MIKFDSHFIKGSASIADLFKEKNRCGIYILTFETGERYVGKTIDIAKRYAQHRRNHPDIDMIQFHCTPEASLTAIEQQTIQTLEAQGYRLRNISQMDKPYFVAPDHYRAIDLVMTNEEQERWLNGEQMREEKAKRRVNPNQRKKYENRINKLENKPYFSLFKEILKIYFEVGIPFPERTEFSSYSVTCLSRTKEYARVNFNNMEVFTALVYEEWFMISLHVSKKTLDGKVSSLKQKYPGLVIIDHKYKPGGNDQIQLCLPDTSEITKFLLEPEVSLAIRTMNLRLMRRGANVYSSSHCPQLVDLALDY